MVRCGGTRLARTHARASPRWEKWASGIVGIVCARGTDIAHEKDTLHVHPKNLHGMLPGISRAGFAWTWSGQPARGPPHAATTPD